MAHKRIKALVIEPQSGLCNRIRAICSAKRLAQKYGREFYIIWNPNLPGAGYGCAGKITQIFSSDNGFNVIEDFEKFCEKRTIVKYQKTTHGPLVLNLERDKEEIVYIRTNLWIYDHKDNLKNTEMFRDNVRSLIPNSRVVRDVERFAKENIDSDTFGIHVRRTDITQTTEYNIGPDDDKALKAAYEPYEKYFNYIDYITKTNPKSKFFIATDNEQTKDLFLNKYDNAIALDSRGYSRTNVEHTQDAMSDMYLLSRCQSVVSCKQSSFGKVASLIGGNSYVDVNSPDSKKGIDLPSYYDGEFKGVIESWAVAMTLSPRKKPTHNETLRSAKLAGFDDIHLFMDGKVEVDDEFSHYPVTIREPKLGAWKNWITTLKELYELYPERDAYAIFQDDVSFCKNVKKFAEKTLWANSERHMGVASFYSPSHYERPIPGWYKRNVGITLRPAVTFVFSPECVESVLRYFKKNPWKRKQNIDNAIGQWGRHTKRYPYFFSPSLCQHTGHTSVISPWKSIKGKRKSYKYVGEDFDAMEFLDGQ